MQVKTSREGVPSISVTLHAADVDTMRTPKRVVDVVFRVSSDALVRILMNFFSTRRMCWSLCRAPGARCTSAMRFESEVILSAREPSSATNQLTRLEMFCVRRLELDNSDSTGRKYLTLLLSYCEKSPPKLSRKKYGVSPAESSRTSAALRNLILGGANPSPPTKSAKSSCSTRCVTSLSFLLELLLWSVVCTGLKRVAVT
mmetsp:Transcript_121543/g.388872  ORF Transcript_121543/g.388872 Transcript_121543/m.388872 type:complete len:201 (-) Transcript_121543:248-850(-)